MALDIVEDRADDVASSMLELASVFESTDSERAMATQADATKTSENDVRVKIHERKG
jgi:hypothetical protein